MMSVCSRLSAWTFLFLSFMLGSSAKAEDRRPSYLEVAHKRFLREVHGYTFRQDGSVDWEAYRNALTSGEMKISRPVSGRAGLRSCMQNDYSYWSYILDVYLQLSSEEKARFWVLSDQLFYRHLGSSQAYGFWTNYESNRHALMIALRLQDPGEVPKDQTPQARLAEAYASGNRVLSSFTGAPTDPETAFKRYVSWNENQTQEMGRFQFWRTMVNWAIPYGLKGIVSSMVRDESAEKTEPALPETPFLKLKKEFYLEIPMYQRDSTGYPVPNGQFRVDRVDERGPSSRISRYFESLPDRDSPFAGSAFLDGPTRAEKISKWIAFVNDPGFLWKKYYAWARERQATAFFDWLIHRYDPKMLEGGCDPNNELCYSGKELFQLPGFEGPYKCENFFLKGKGLSASQYTFEFGNVPEANLKTLVDCYCAD